MTAISLRQYGWTMKRNPKRFWATVAVTGLCVQVVCTGLWFLSNMEVRAFQWVALVAQAVGLVGLFLWLRERNRDQQQARKR